MKNKVLSNLQFVLLSAVVQFLFIPGEITVIQISELVGIFMITESIANIFWTIKLATAVRQPFLLENIILIWSKCCCVTKWLKELF